MKQFEVFGEIKDYADENNILLNSRLSSEQKPIVVDEITVDFEKQEDGLEIYPKIADKEESFNQDLVDKFDRGEEVRNFYNVDDDATKRKVIFKNKESAEKVKRNRHLSGEDELKFYNGNNELWEDGNLNLSNFGPRVKGFGYLNYRANPSSQKETDRSWFDSDTTIEFPKIYSKSGESITLQSEDRDKLATAVREINEEDKEVIGVDFTDDETGEDITIPLNEQQLSSEIEKINNATVSVDQISSITKLENLKKKLANQDNQEIVDFEGRFVKTCSLSYVEERLKEIKKEREKSEQNKQKKKDLDKEKENQEKSILIDENLDSEDYVVSPENDKQWDQLELPELLDADLYPHQELGVQKLQFLYNNDPVNGLLLADDMGLGKTLILLTFLAWLKENQNLESSLVVAPTTLINDWDNLSKNNPGEIQKFFPNDLFSTYKIRGKIDKKDKSKINDADIVFTSYNSLRINNIKLGQLHWDVMICDEAQKVKNATTQTSVAVKAQNVDFKVACSATPIENDLLDLWNIMDYTVPGILGSRDNFKQKFVNKSNEISATDKRKDLNQKLATKIEENFLRRNKKEELEDLPEKKIEVFGVPANQSEIDKIDELNQLREEGVNHLPLIQKLVALCSHIALIDDDIKQSNIENLVEMSSKLQKIKEIITRVRERDEKVIIFTIFKNMQKILIEAINYWFGFAPSVLNGSIAQNKRQGILDKYRQSEGFNAIVLSPEVAGVGIDLVEANHVIHYTRLWNPAKEDQSTDRAYRIGQKKDVFVYYPILTLEDKYHYKFNSEVEFIDEYLDANVKRKSPEEKLNKLLVQKKNLLLNFFFATGETKVNWDSIDEEENKGDYINLNNVFSLLDPYEFEILIAKVYQRAGYKVYPTVKSGDQGVDVVALKGNNLTLIQCKQIKNDKLSGSAINEVFGGQNIYKNQLEKELDQLVVVTTAEGITNHSKSLAEENNVTITLKDELAHMLRENKIYYSEIDVDSEERYSIEKLKHLVC
jgi:SNF2 family DNA or RNA helicase